MRIWSSTALFKAFIYTGLFDVQSYHFLLRTSSFYEPLGCIIDYVLVEMLANYRILIIKELLMAIFEGKKQTESKAYVALMDTNDNLVAFVSPVKGVSNELLVKSLKEKGLNVEIKEPKADVLELSL